MKKKLSVAIRKGEKIAQELGIKHGVGHIAEVDEEGAICMCSLGKVLLSIMPPEEVLDMAKNYSREPYKVIEKTFLKANKNISCLGNVVPTYYIYRKNDNFVHPLTIAEQLEACGL